MTIRATLIAIACTASMVAHAIADNTKRVNVPAGNLTEAIETLAKQCGVDAIYPSAELKGLRTKGVIGSLEPLDAFKKLIEGTPLTLKEEGGSVLISLPRANSKNVPGEKNWNSTRDDSVAGDQAPRSSLRLAQTNEGSAQSTASVGSQHQQESQGPPTVLQEIIVTAQKREEPLEQVPIPVTVLDAQALSNSNQVKLQDYYASIPGLSLNTLSSGRGNTPQLAFRGISAPGTNPTVGIIVDDVPYGSAIFNGGGAYIPDIDPSDLVRIEALRGPQGTLYGASSMGGLLKFVTARPSTDEFSGRVQAGLIDVKDGDGIGYTVRGSVNIPVTDELAVRASAFARRTPGYIDNPVLGLKGVNKEDGDGGRFSALWRPSADFSLTLSALIQDTKRYGSSDEQPSITVGQTTLTADRQQDELRGAGIFDRKSQIFTANASANLSGATLTSITGYNINKVFDTTDFSAIFGSPTLVKENVKTDKFSQEVRLDVPLGATFDWLVGAFYQHEKTSYTQDVHGVDPVTAVDLGSSLLVSFPTTYQEYSGFTDLTVKFSERFDVQFGVRESHENQTYVLEESGTLIGPTPFLQPEAKSDENAFTYLVTPKFQISPDLMVYARIASGYRPGGPNPGLESSNAPKQFGSDKTENYEIGSKGKLFENVLSFDASVYYINWKDVQLNEFADGFGYTDNGGKAVSKGVELAVQVRPTKGLTFSTWAAYNAAHLTEDLPATSTSFGKEGDPLPFVSKWSGYASVDQAVSLGDGVKGTLGGELSYVGDRLGPYLSTPGPRQVLSGYWQLNLHTSLLFGTWLLELSANNVTDRRGLLSGGEGNPVPNTFTFIQPRTIGLSAAKTF